MDDQPHISLALVDDHDLIRVGIRAFLAEQPVPITVVAVAATVAELRDGPGRDAQVVLLDLDLRDGTTVEDNIAALRSPGGRAGGAAVVIVSVNEDAPMVRRAVRAGAMGYVPKSADKAELVDAICAAVRGESYMSRALALALVSDDAHDRPELSPQEVRNPTALRRRDACQAGGPPPRRAGRHREVLCRSDPAQVREGRP